MAHERWWKVARCHRDGDAASVGGELRGDAVPGAHQVRDAVEAVGAFQGARPAVDEDLCGQVTRPARGGAAAAVVEITAGGAAQRGAGLGRAGAWAGQGAAAAVVDVATLSELFAALRSAAATAGDAAAATGIAPRAGAAVERPPAAV